MIGIPLPFSVWRTNRRCRAGMLINVILGMLLLSGLAAASYSYFRQGSSRAEAVEFGRRATLIATEVRRLWHTRPGQGRRDWTNDVMVQSSLGPEYFTNMQIWFVMDIQDEFQIRFYDVSWNTCQYLTSRVHLLGPGARGVDCRSGSQRTHVVYRLD